MTSPSQAPSSDQLLRLISEHSLLNEIAPSRLQGLKEELSWVELEAQQVLFCEGDPVDAFYFVIDGSLEVSTIQEGQDGDPSNDRLVLAVVDEGSTIGEMTILTGGKRSATVTAVKQSRLVRCPKSAIDHLLANDPHAVEELTKTIMPRLYRDQVVDILPKLFGELNEQMLHDLESKMTWMHAPRGHVLCSEGEPSDSVYIIINGRMQVLVNDASGKPREVCEVSQGESVGEMGVFTGEPRSATVIASRDSELVEFSKEEFDEFTAKYPQFMQRLVRLLIKRLQGSYQDDREPALSCNILLAPVSDGAPLDEFSANLFGAICTAESETSSKLQPCLLLTSKVVDELIGHEGVAQSDKGEPDDLRLRSWLSQQEKTHRVILFQTDFVLNSWTRRCISSTDQVMFVGNASDTPKASEIVPEIHRQDETTRTHRRRSLVLLHDRGVSRPTGTMGWLRALNLMGETSSQQITARHFHVRRGNDDDCGRVARFLLGREVGLVLSGGGARGFAHVGCIRAMRELGIPIDVIGGVSMGSLVSAAYAYDEDNFEETMETIKSQLKGVLFDFTAPVVSFARGRRFDRRLQNWFQDVKIEDLWIPYFCVSSNLTEANLVVWESDDLWYAVRASGTLPGLSSPVIYNNCLLFDGCLLDNLPMDVMRQRLGSSHVVAVDVVPPHDLKVEVTKLQSPSGWWLLWNRLNPFSKKVELPNIVSIMHRAAELSSVYGRQQLIEKRLADIYLRPPVDVINIADFGAIGESARIGYEHCKQPLSEWWASRRSVGFRSQPTMVG